MNSDLVILRDLTKLVLSAPCELFKFDSNVHEVTSAYTEASSLPAIEMQDVEVDAAFCLKTELLTETLLMSLS